MSDNKICKKRIFTGARWDMRGHPCTNKAVTDAGFCRVCDPDEKAKRRAKRGPTKFERESAANKKAADRVAKKDDRIKLLEKLLREAIDPDQAEIARDWDVILKKAFGDDA